MAQLVAQQQGAQRAQGVDKQRVRPVEGVDVAAAIGGRRPARGLHRTGTFQGELVAGALLAILRNAAFPHQPQEVAVRADVVKPVIVNARVRQVRRHDRHRPLAANLQELALSGGVELEDGRAELKALRPLGPSPAGVPAAGSENGRAF